MVISLYGCPDSAQRAGSCRNAWLARDRHTSNGSLPNCSTYIHHRRSRLSIVTTSTSAGRSPPSTAISSVGFHFAACPCEGSSISWSRAELSRPASSGPASKPTSDVSTGGGWCWSCGSRSWYCRECSQPALWQSDRETCVPTSRSPCIAPNPIPQALRMMRPPMGVDAFSKLRGPFKIKEHCPQVCPKSDSQATQACATCPHFCSCHERSQFHCCFDLCRGRGFALQDIAVPSHRRSGGTPRSLINFF